MPHECINCGKRFENGSKQMLSGCPDCGGNKFQFQPAGRDTGSTEPSAPSSRPATGDIAGSTDDGSTDVTDSTDKGSTDVTGPADSSPPANESPLPDDSSLPDDSPSADDVPGADVEREPSELAPERKHERAERDHGQATFDDVLRDAEIDEGVGEENSAQSDARSSAATTDEITEARRKMADVEQSRLTDVDDNARGTPQGPPTEPPSGEESAAFDVSGAVGPDDVDPVEKQPVGGSTGEPAEPIADENRDLAALREELNDQFESIKITAPGQYELNLMELFDREEYIISLQEDGRYVIEMADDYGVDDR